MNKLKRIISLAFIIAFALSQFEYVKAESVEADMTDAKNAETVVASEEAEKEEVNKDAEAVSGCKTQADTIKELEDELDKKVDSINTKNEDYTLRISKVKDPKENQDPNKYVVHYQLSFTILNKEKTFDSINMMSLAGAISELLIDNKIDKMRINEEKDIDLASTLNGSPQGDYKHAISEMIIEGIKNSLNLNDQTTLGEMHTKNSGIRISKGACDNKDAFIWFGVPFQNAIVNEIKDKIEAKDITVNKNDKVNWKDGVKLKDAYKNIQGYQGNINEATVTDESARNTKTAGVKSGNIKLKFSDDTELTLENQKLIVKEDKKAEEKELLPQRKDNENNKYDRYDRNDRYDRYNKDKKNESNEKNIKESKNDKVTKETKPEEKAKTEEKQDHGIQAPAQALRLVQHKDLPQGEKGEATRELIARGILSGVSDTEFKGKLAINRAMLAQVLMTISKDKSVGFVDYLDIKGDEWYADAMTWALTHGIYKGYTDKTVKAAQNITRQEFASVIYNFIKEHNINMPKVKEFNYKDQDKIASWALNQVKYLDELGLVNGENMDNYNAQGTYTREDLALTIYKIIKFIENK